MDEGKEGGSVTLSKYFQLRINDAAFCSIHQFSVRNREKRDSHWLHKLVHSEGVPAVYPGDNDL